VQRVVVQASQDGPLLWAEPHPARTSWRLLLSLRLHLVLNHVVHADTGDARGIDVAFIYDDNMFEVPLPREEWVFFHIVLRRNATGEIVR
jgi:hypothetical protein